METGTTDLVGVPTHGIGLLEELRRRGNRQLGRVWCFRISAAAVPPAVVSTVIDLTAHAAVAVQTGAMAPTIDLRVGYLRAAPGVTLLARGRSIARADVEGWAGTDRLCALGRGRFQIP